MPSTAATTFAEICSDAPPHGPVMRLGVAIVLGGSVAGMLAARVLADHAETVLIIERDGDAQGGAARHGVPQGAQAHTLLAAGAAQLERWFPGFTERAVAGGASRITSGDSLSYLGNVPKVRVGDRAMLAMTRPYLEGRIRAELAAFTNVKTVTGRVTGLGFGGSAVTGVRYETAGVDGLQPADLVVDALGRASRVSDWLEQGGWDRPPMLRCGDGINYATAFFRRPAGDVPVRWAASLDDAGGGAMFQTVEGGRYIVMQGGLGAARPGATAGDMIARLRHVLPAPFGHVAENEMIGDVVTYRQADSRRRDFWACTQLPARLIAVGDAVASFNPLYGQGISSAALHASALSIYLRSSPDLDLPARDFLALQKVVVDAAWSISAPSGAAGGLRHRLVRQIVRASAVDPRVAEAFAHVTQMTRHPQTLTAPGVVLQSLLAGLRRLPAPTPPIEPREGPPGHGE